MDEIVVANIIDRAHDRVAFSEGHEPEDYCVKITFENKDDIIKTRVLLVPLNEPDVTFRDFNLEVMQTESYHGIGAYVIATNENAHYYQKTQQEDVFWFWSDTPFAEIECLDTSIIITFYLGEKYDEYDILDILGRQMNIEFLGVCEEEDEDVDDDEDEDKFEQVQFEMRDEDTDMVSELHVMTDGEMLYGGFMSKNDGNDLTDCMNLIIPSIRSLARDYDMDPEELAIDILHTFQQEKAGKYGAMKED